MTKITMHGGVNEIGGNKILLSDRSTRVFLDFGLSYNQWGKYFEEYLKPRASAGMSDLVKTGLLPDPSVPDFRGVFRSDYLRLLGAQPSKSPGVQAVLLSHIHYDHSAYIAFLHESVPVYASPATAAIAEALSICGQRDFEKEIYEFKFRPIEKSTDPANPRKWVEVIPGKKTKIDGLEVYGLPVDHSVPGAMLYVVYSSEGSLLYTGDLRVEGYGTDTVAALRSLEGEEIDLMLCEGTRINEADKKTEDYIRSFAKDLALRASGLVVADFAFRDVQRLKTFLEVAKLTGRTMVITLKDAIVLQKLRIKGYDAPDPRNDPSIEVLIERKRKGRFDDSDYDTWEREFLGWKNVLKSTDVASKGNRRILHAGFFDMTTLLDFEMPEGSRYIHSSSEPHNEEQLIDQKRMDNWLELLRLPKFHVHASGHACREELQQLVDKTRPSRLVPIHTEHPEMFSQLHPRVAFPILGTPISLRQ